LPQQPPRGTRHSWVRADSWHGACPRVPRCPSHRALHAPKKPNCELCGWLYALGAALMYMLKDQQPLMRCCGPRWPRMRTSPSVEAWAARLCSPNALLYISAGSANAAPSGQLPALLHVPALEPAPLPQPATTLPSKISTPTQRSPVTSSTCLSQSALKSSQPRMAHSEKS